MGQSMGARRTCSVGAANQAAGWADVKHRCKPQPNKPDSPTRRAHTRKLGGKKKKAKAHLAQHQSRHHSEHHKDPGDIEDV